MKRHIGTVVVLSAAAVLALFSGLHIIHAQQAPALTPQDYIAIQQLVSKYAYAIDECTNKGYDYADLYTPDGTFATARAGKTLNTFAGRERLAAAARGGMPDCKDVPWAGIVHMLVNHVIEADQVIPKARSLADRVAANGPLAIQQVKRTVRDAMGRSLPDGYRLEDESKRIVFASDDAKEGPRAFLEKRAARFIGR